LNKIIADLQQVTKINSTVGLSGFESWLSNKKEQSPSGGCFFFCLYQGLEPTFYGVPENFNFWGERRARETYRCDEVASQSEGFERDKGCILISGYDEQQLTARWLAEQSAHEEIRLEICDHTNLTLK
jgi:hypothetical protein